jgi:hypothetical protein
MEIESLIAESRKRGLADGDIEEKLVGAGWDRQTVVARLNRKESDLPVPPPPSTTPLQVENVQTSVIGGEVPTRMGILTFFFAASAASLGWVAFSFLHEARMYVLDQGFDSLKFREGLAMDISLLLFGGLVFWYCRRRIDGILRDTPAAANDIFFRRNIRYSLRFSLILALLFGFIVVMSGLQSILADMEFDSAGFIDTLSMGLVFASLTALFWGYSKKSST